MKKEYANVILDFLGAPLPIEGYYDQLRVKFDDTEGAVEIFESYIDEEVDNAFLCDHNLSPLTSGWAVFEYKDGHTFFVYPVEMHSSGIEYSISEEVGKNTQVDNRFFGLKMTMRALHKLSLAEWYADREHSEAESALAEKTHNKRVALYAEHYKNLMAMTVNIMSDLRDGAALLAKNSERKTQNQTGNTNDKRGD